MGGITERVPKMRMTLNVNMITREATSNVITKPEHVFEVMEDISTMQQEAFFVLTLNTKNKLLGRHMVALGTINSTVIGIPEIFRTAIIDNAKSIILCHNHPSGDPTPSPNDIRLTSRLVEAGKVMDIEVFDHVIVGRNQYFSLRETACANF